MVTHGLIDYGKIVMEKKLEAKSSNHPPHNRHLFLINQFLHLLVILLVWLYLTDGFSRVVPFLGKLFSDPYYLAPITAIIFLTRPAGIAIEKLTASFREQINTNDSLDKAGMYIGILERLLVFFFILLGQYSAIGFLIASKSILRITGKEEDSRKKTEYVLIGTLISFTIAFLTGAAVKWILREPQYF